MATDIQRPFAFERDTFCFRNELVWEYRFDQATGAVTTFRSQPPPTYAHRCFVLVRSIRQFFYHALFAREQPRADKVTYRQLIRQVVSRNPRTASPASAKIIIPGFSGLREFSRAYESLLKAECGGAWQSYCVRSHWRMAFPISRRHQEAMARQLMASLEKNPVVIIHLVRFPQLTINHGILLFGVTRQPDGLQFSAYDPNIPEQPVTLSYKDSDRSFYFPRNHYWIGGRLDVIETYRNWFY
jgi:hypothetical protein